MASSELDDRVINLIANHCRVTPHGTLEWKERRPFTALTNSVDSIGTDDMASAVHRCRDLSAASHEQTVIGSLQRLFHDFGGLAAEPNWQHVVDSASRLIPCHAAAVPDLLGSIRLRRGRVAPPSEIVDRRLRCRMAPVEEHAQADGHAVEPANEPNDNADAPMPESLEEARALIAHYRGLLQDARQRATNTQRQNTRTMAKLQDQLDAHKAQLERSTFHNIPKRIRRVQSEKGFSRHSHIQSGRLSTTGGYRLALKHLQGYAAAQDTTHMLTVSTTRQTIVNWEVRLA